MAGAEGSASRQWASEDPLIGTVVNGRFHIVKRIARGGMGSVYFATQAPLSRPVAVKVLNTLRSGDQDSQESFRRRFLREASILAKLQHPNVVMLLDYGQISEVSSERYFMAMEYLRGETLATRFRSKGRLGIVESLRLARQIGRGLREAHRCGFVHRDLKPSNVMLVPDDEAGDMVKLVDFGIGKIMGGRPEAPRDGGEETQAGLLLGSPRYMSPEQIRSEPIEPRTDCYGLGVTLFEALTGRVPFDGGTSFDVMVSHCLTTPPGLGEVCPGERYPASLSSLVSQLLEKQPTRRPPIEEVLQRLTAVEEEIFRDETLTAPSSKSIAPLAVPNGARAEGAVLKPEVILPPTLASGEPPPPSSSPAGFWRGARRSLFWAGLVSLLLFLLFAVTVGRFTADKRRVRVAAASRSAPAASSASEPSSALAPFDGHVDEEFVTSDPSGTPNSDSAVAAPGGLRAPQGRVGWGPKTFPAHPQGAARAVGPLDGASAPGDGARVKKDEAPGLDIRLRR